MEYQNEQFQKSNAGQGMGIAALVLGILGVLTAFIPCFGLFAIIFGILAIVFGIIGYSQAKKGNAALGMPITGLILGIVATVFVLIWTLFFATAILASSNDIKKATQEMQDTLDAYSQDTDTDTIISDEE